ncbi:YceD family protein [Kaarinaea lacus]
MSQRLPEFIEPYRLAENKRVLKGELSIANMNRLTPLLASNAGNVEVDLAFAIDETGQAYVKGKVHTRVSMQCQRCMNAMELPINAKVSLAFVATEEQAQDLPSHYEPMIVEEETSLSGLVEDEIILALPAVPLHEPEQCSVEGQYGGSVQDATTRSGTDSNTERQNPFAVLEKLRKKD